MARCMQSTPVYHKGLSRGDLDHLQSLECHEKHLKLQCWKHLLYKEQVINSLGHFDSYLGFSLQRVGTWSCSVQFDS